MSTTRSYCFPYFSSRRSLSYSSSSWLDPPQSPPPSTWQSRSISAFKKVREWSELAVGPKWKTFICRFNRGNSRSSASGGKFQYDPLSYALKFDEGPHPTDKDLDTDDFTGFSYSSWYAAISAYGSGNSFIVVNKLDEQSIRFN